MTKLSSKQRLGTLTLQQQSVVNRRSVDVVVKDFFGVEHVLFPGEEKKVMMLVNERKPLT